MPERISRTRGGDAPLSTAKNPDPTATSLNTEEEDMLVGRTVSINRPRQELHEF